MSSNFDQFAVFDMIYSLRFSGLHLSAALRRMSWPKGPRIINHPSCVEFLANDGDLFSPLMEWTGRQKMFQYSTSLMFNTDQDVPMAHTNTLMSKFWSMNWTYIHRVYSLVRILIIINHSMRAKALGFCTNGFHCCNMQSGRNVNETAYLWILCT